MGREAKLPSRRQPDLGPNVRALARRRLECPVPVGAFTSVPDPWRTFVKLCDPQLMALLRPPTRLPGLLRGLASVTSGAATTPLLLIAQPPASREQFRFSLISYTQESCQSSRNSLDDHFATLRLFPHCNGGLLSACTDS